MNKFKVESLSGVTYFTYERYDSADDAYDKLALHKKPEFRVGPIPEEEFPYIPYKGVVIPTQTQTGGAPEIYINETLFLTSNLDPVYLLAIYDLHARKYLKACCEVLFLGEKLVEKLTADSSTGGESDDINWDKIKTQYEDVKVIVTKFAEEKHLTIRPFPWDAPVVNLIGGNFSFDVGFAQREQRDPIWVSIRIWLPGQKAKEELIAERLEVQEIKQSLEKAMDKTRSIMLGPR